MNRIILITGSSSGIGKYMAKCFLEAGDNVIITGNSKPNLEYTQHELKEFKNKAIYIQMDVTNEESIIHMFKVIKQNFNKIDVLINNAAFDEMSSIEEYKYALFEKIVKTNLLGKMACIKHATNLLKKSKYPSIINIASRLAQKPMLKSSAYCCSAAGIVMLTKCAALELANYNIRVNCISPSLTLTPLAKKSYSEYEIEQTAKKSLNNRLCQMSDIYNVVKFLISEEADYINGENINVNGGILLR